MFPAIAYLAYTLSLATSPEVSAPAPDLSIEPVLLTTLAEQGGVPNSAFHYTYGEVGLSLGDLDGIRVAGSYHLQDQWLIVASLGILEASRVDFTFFSAGAGYVHNIQEDLDIVATAELEFGRAEVDFLGSSASDSEVGLRLRGGARYMLDERFEFYGGGNLRTTFDTDFFVDGGALYRINDRLQAYASLEVGDDTQFGIGVRYGF